jgi:hypothetical protein
VPLGLEPGRHHLEVLADPQQQILEDRSLQSNNRVALEVVV